MNNINYNGRKVAYFTAGKGRAVVLLHGFCEDSRIWEEFSSDFDGYQKIYIDLPGLGKSEVPVDASIAYMADAVQEVLQTLKIKECTMIGHSMGGYVSLAFAKKYPTFLNGLCLFHSHPFADSEEKKAARTKSIGFIKRNGPILYIKQLVPALFNTSFVRSNKFLIEKMTKRAVEYSTEGIVACLEAMRDRPDSREVLETANFPVCFIVGQKDTAIPTTSSMEQLYIPKISDIHILSKAAHMGMFELKKQTQRIIKNFCSFCEPKT